MSEDNGPIRKRRWRAARWLAGVFLFVGLASVILVPAYYRARCGASMLVSSSFMRQVATQHSLDSSAGDPSRNVGIMLVEGVLDDGVFRGMCYSDNLSDVVVRGRALQTIRSDNRKLEVVKAEIRSSVDSETWESVGRFRFSHEANIFDTYDSQIIIGLSCYEHGSVLIGFAGVFVYHSNSRQELREYIELDRAAREKHGLAPLIDFEQEIDDYRARKNLEPLRD